MYVYLYVYVCIYKKKEISLQLKNNYVYDVYVSTDTYFSDDFKSFGFFLGESLINGHVAQFLTIEHLINQKLLIEIP